MTSVHVTVRRTHGPVTEVAVTGEIDLHTAPHVRQAVLDLLERGHRRLVLDLSGVQYCDSAGLSTLIIVWHTARKTDGHLSLAAVPDSLLVMLSLTGVDTVVTVHPTVADALDASSEADSPSGADSP